MQLVHSLEFFDLFFNSLRHCTTKIDFFDGYSPLRENTHNQGSGWQVKYQRSSLVIPCDRESDFYTMTKIIRAKKVTKKNAYAFPKGMGQSQKAVKSIKAQADKKRTFIEIVADRTTALFGSNIFLFANILIFIAWITINTGLVPGVKPFDKFPFSLLTTIVSLEAIILAILVLISQNRAAKVADLREEVQLQVNVLTEEEITRVMWMLILLLQKNRIPIPEDERLQQMLQDTDVEKIEKNMEKQINKA